MRIGEVMSEPVRTVRAGATVAEAVDLLTGSDRAVLPVVDEHDRLVGLVTAADLVVARTMGGVVARRTVGGVMRTPVTATGPDADIVDVTTALLGSGQPGLPIVDGVRVIGIVTRDDLERVVGRDDDLIARDVQHRLEVYGASHHSRVRVDNGVVTIVDDFVDETDRHVAAAVAEAVPGVVRARTATEPSA